MPIPSPNKDEKKKEFIPRCISIVAHVDTKRPHDQVVAMCYSAWSDAHKHRSLFEAFKPEPPDKVICYVCMSARAKPEFVRKGDILYFKSLALAPGTWTGIDGHTTKYDAGVIMAGAPSFAYKRLKSRHDTKDINVVGFTTGYALVDGTCWVDGYIFDQQEIKEMEEDIATGKALGLSPELTCPSSFDASLNIWNAQAIAATGFSFVETPACKECWVEEIKRVKMPAV